MMQTIIMNFFKKIAIFLMAIPFCVLAAPVSNAAIANAPVSTAELSQQLESLKLEIAEQAHDISHLQLSTEQEFKRIDERLNYVEKSLNVLSANSPQPVSEAESATNAFNAAMNFVKETQYQQAESALQAFIIAYHSSDYVPRAYYELSAVEVKLNDFNKAMHNLDVLINSYSTSPYVSQAMLLLGDIHNSLGEWDVAKKQWSDVVAHYPNTPEATHAQSLLLQLQQAGH